MVYVCEAHSYLGETENVRKTVKMSHRVRSALDLARQLSLSIPVLVDPMDNRTYNAYKVYEAAFFVLDSQGRQAFRSGEVPHGLRPDQVEAALKRLVPSPAS